MRRVQAPAAQVSMPVNNPSSQISAVTAVAFSFETALQALGHQLTSLAVAISAQIISIPLAPDVVSSWMKVVEL